MISSSFKDFVFLPLMFCELGYGFWWMTFISDVFSVFVLIPTIQTPPKYILFFVFSIQSKMKVCGVWGKCWSHSQRWQWPHSEWNKKPSNIHALSTQLSSDKVTHSGINQFTAAVFYIGQHVCWCDWLVTQNSRYWHKICNISGLNSHFLGQLI